MSCFDKTLCIQAINGLALEQPGLRTMQSGFVFADTDYDDLVDSIYKTTTDPDSWPEFLQQLTRVFGGRAVIYRYSPRNRESSQVACVADYGPYTEAYQSYYHKKNVWITDEAPTSNAFIVPSEAVVPEQELIKTEFYAEYLRPQDLRHGLSCHLVAANDDIFRLGLIRSKRIGPFEDPELKLIARLRPHLQRAIDVSQQLEGVRLQRAAGLEALDRLQAAALIVDNMGRIQCSNAAAEEVLDCNSALLVAHGRLRADANVRGAIAFATGCGRFETGREARVVPVFCRASGRSFSVAVSPIDQGTAPTFGCGPLALVLITRQDASVSLSEAQLRAAYALTPAEARLAAALCAGESLSAYAARTDISLTTAKWHLRSLFQKTGERRQVDLVRRLSADPGLRAA